MTAEHFHRSLFELVDTWTNVVDEKAYVDWLVALLWAVSENKSQSNNDKYNLVLRPLDDVVGMMCLDKIDGTLLHVPPRCERCERCERCVRACVIELFFVSVACVVM